MERTPRILVADDVPANIATVREQLSALGYEVIGAGDGPSALEACRRDRPDLCILNVAMPAGALGGEARDTGFEVCRRIKKDPATARVPVIFVTSLQDAGDRLRAIEAGGDDFLTPPHDAAVLRARVRSLLHLKSATDALEESYRQLRELERVRDDLMKMIVHDLKTPLTSVLATLEMVLDQDFGPVSDAQRRALGDAETKAEELLALIEDLLEVARIEETSLTLALAPIAPGAFLTEVVHEWEARFLQAGAAVRVDVDDGAPVFAGDRAVLKRVFGNLLENAITHAGSPVGITLRARPEPGGGILFTVADNGAGIPTEYHQVIFRKFERVKRPELPRARNSGLGLAFCKLAVEAHGGRIWVQSAPGEGSQFHLVLPAAR